MSESAEDWNPKPSSSPHYWNCLFHFPHRAEPGGTRHVFHRGEKRKRCERISFESLFLSPGQDFATLSGDSLRSFFFFFVLRFELGLNLEPLHKHFFVMGFFEIGPHQLFAQGGFLTLNLKPPDLCLLSSQDYRGEPPATGFSLVFK
jgi:hypothetical protein